MSVGRCNTENVFMDESVPVDVRPHIRERNELNLSRIDLMYNNIKVDSVLACGQEPMRDSSPARLSAPQVLYPINTPSNSPNLMRQLSYSEELLLLMTPETKIPCSKELSRS